MLVSLFRSTSSRVSTSRSVSALAPRSSLVKPNSLCKRVAARNGLQVHYGRENLCRKYCKSTIEYDDDADYTIVTPDNPRLTHKEAIQLLADNDLLKNETAFKVFSETDPECFAPSETDKMIASYTKEESEESLTQRELDELYMDNWLHSALTIIGTVSVLDDIIKPGGKVLDLACGNGFMTVLLAKMVYPGGRVMGIDHSEEKLADAQKTIDTHFPELSQSIKLVKGDVFVDLPKKTIFDAIHVAGGVQEVPQVWLDMVKPGGCVIAATPEIEPQSGETQFMLRKYHVRPEGGVLPVNMMFVNFEELVEPKL